MKTQEQLDLAYNILEHVLDDRQYNQGVWAEQLDPADVVADIVVSKTRSYDRAALINAKVGDVLQPNECGTQACIAGWAVHETDGFSYQVKAVDTTVKSSRYLSLRIGGVPQSDFFIREYRKDPDFYFRFAYPSKEGRKELLRIFGVNSASDLTDWQIEDYELCDWTAVAAKRLGLGHDKAVRIFGGSDRTTAVVLFCHEIAKAEKKLRK